LFHTLLAIRAKPCSSLPFGEVFFSNFDPYMHFSEKFHYFGLFDVELRILSRCPSLCINSVQQYAHETVTPERLFIQMKPPKGTSSDQTALFVPSCTILRRTLNLCICLKNRKKILKMKKRHANVIFPACVGHHR
jgi:hypothetical protein